MQLRLVIVPGWVRRAIETAKKPMETLLDLGALSTILSKEDVVLYYHLNNTLFHKGIHPYVSDTFTLFDFIEQIMVPGGTDFSDETFFRLLERTEVEHKNPSLALLKDDVMADVDAGGSHTAFDYSFELSPIRDGVLGYHLKEIPILKSGDPSSIEVVQEHFNALDFAIKRMLTYLTFEEVARTKMFSSFCRVARNAVAV